MKKVFLFSCCFAILLSSCNLLKSVNFVPAYNAGIIADVKLGTDLTIKLYDAAIAGDQTYNASDTLYSMLAGQITSIERKENARPKSIGKTALLTIIKNLQSAFVKYRNEHKKKGILSKAELSLNKNYLLPHWQSLLSAEKSLN